MRTAFVGAVEGSAIALDALVRAGMPPDMLITLEAGAADRHSDFVDLGGRGQAAGIEVVRTRSVNSQPVLEALSALEPDLVLVIGWSQICRGAFRSIARMGNIGFHPAPLPRMRGRAVIPWTILLGEPSTAATLFWLDEGIDSGPILLQEQIAVADDETARTLYAKQTNALASMLPRAVELARSGNAPRIEQDHRLATYCAKRTPDDGRINWHQPADAILRLIRAAGDPYPGAFTTNENGRLVIDAAASYEDSHRYIGLAGQVQCETDEGFVVRCGDGECIHVTQWRQGGASAKPRVHSKLGAVFAP
ncbi:methionyl-tRNA formyltransferase [Arvimicrobium flavum]|uniref:methionyl-tRNA formyltransferase n=1 Tax=Arvimicrobium flavum TaxID=3393320 RepID=UPI00237ADD62|nr:formyltransferase family protein [Mesorhizobium shangrilense]